MGQASVNPKLPINEKPYQNMVQSESSVTSDQMIDAIFTDAQKSRRRPALATLSAYDLSGVSQGEYYWKYRNKWISVYNGLVYDNSSGAPVVLAGGALLHTTNPCVFADNGTTLFIANGGKILVVTFGAPCTQALMVDADAPTVIYSICFFGSYLMATNGSSEFTVYYSDASAPTAWTSTNFFSVGYESGKVQQVVSNNNYLYVFTDKTIEVWYNDGVSPFAKQTDIQFQNGVLDNARYSLQRIRDRICWMDQYFNVCVLENNQVDIISRPIAQYLKDTAFPTTYTTASRVTGTFIIDETNYYYIINCVRLNKTFVFDFIHQCWYQWGYYLTTSSTYDYFLGEWAVWNPGLGKTVLSSSRNGHKLYFDYDLSQDRGSTTLAVGTTNTKVSSTAFNYIISSVQYGKAAVAAGTAFTLAHTINVGAAAGLYWGIFLVQINAAGTISTKVPGADQVYTTEALAIAALPSVDASNISMGYLTIQSKTGVAWTANTDDLVAASDCNAINFTHSTNSCAIRFLKRTGNYDYGTGKKKISTRTRLILERGNATTGSPTLDIRVLDDNYAWSGTTGVDLGVTSDTLSIVEAYLTGNFYRRSLELVNDDDMLFTIIDAEDDIEISI